MFGFPIPIYDRTQGTPQPFTPTIGDNSGFPTPNRREIFYSIKDGNWNDITIWQTASGRVGLLPTVNDDVYIRHTIYTNATTVNINNLFININGNLKYDNAVSARTFNIYGNLQCIGTVDTTSSTGFGLVLNLYGLNNRIDNYIIDSVSTITSINYYATLSQNILPVTHRQLGISNGPKYAVSNITITYNLFAIASTGASLEMGTYDLNIFGTIGSVSLGFSGALYKSGSGNILVTGLWTFNQYSSFIFTGNPTIECRGGITVSVNNGSDSNFNLGTGVLSFTTNNQSLSSVTTAYSLQFYNTIIIGSGVTLTCNLVTVNLKGTINGTNGTSSLLMTGTGILNFQTATSVNSMTIGTWDFTTNANTIGYIGNYSVTIPSYFTNFYNLSIAGTGTKTLGVNTVLNGNLSVSTGGIIECSTFNLSVAGTTTFPATSGQLSKTGAGSILFVGSVQFGNNNASPINFTGNPSVECRGGLLFTNSNLNSGIAGTGIWSFTTNNQTFSYNAGASGIIWLSTMLIASGITVTNNQATVNILSSLNGASSTSSFINKSTLGLYSTTTPMTTGILDVTSFVNTVTYGYVGNLTIPLTNLWNLTLATTSGTSTYTLSNNTTLLGNLQLLSGVAGTGMTLQLSTFNLTVTGTTNAIAAWGVIKKSGAGAVVFIGNVNLGNSTNSWIDFSGGNPTVEVRGGISTYNTTSSFNSGTGTWTFSTNNQAITHTTGSTGNFTFSGNILVSGAITVTYTTLDTFVFSSSLNGDNAASTWLMNTGTTLNYQSATQPMSTGILDTSTNLNTWIYGSGNQNILGGASTGAKQVYRNLTLNGTGVKTLQGYVSVLNTYTLTSPATLALNGFTLTNP